MLENSQCLRFDPAPESESASVFPVVVAIWIAANGEVVPRPSVPVAESKKNGEMPAFPKRMVDDAKSPPKSWRAVVVDCVFVPV